MAPPGRPATAETTIYDYTYDAAAFDPDVTDRIDRGPLAERFDPDVTRLVDAADLAAARGELGPPTVPPLPVEVSFVDGDTRRDLYLVPDLPDDRGWNIPWRTVGKAVVLSVSAPVILVVTAYAAGWLALWEIGLALWVVLHLPAGW